MVIVVVAVRGFRLTRERVLNHEILAETLFRAPVLDFMKLGPVLVARVLADELNNVGRRRNSDVASEIERRDEDAVPNRTCGVYVRHPFDQEMRVADLDVVAVVLKAF